MALRKMFLLAMVTVLFASAAISAMDDVGDGGWQHAKYSCKSQKMDAHMILASHRRIAFGPCVRPIGCKVYEMELIWQHLFVLFYF